MFAKKKEMNAQLGFKKYLMAQWKEKSTSSII